MAQVEELYRVRGFDAAAVARLRPYVTALPARARECQHRHRPRLLAPSSRNSGARRSAPAGRSRRGQPFKDRADLKRRAKGAPAAFEVDLDVKSDHFLVQVGVAQDDVQVATEALVARAAPGQEHRGPL